MRTICFITIMLLYAHKLLAYDNPKIYINGEEINKYITQLTFNGDEMTVHYSDGTTATDSELSSLVIYINNTVGIKGIRIYDATIDDDSLIIKGLENNTKVALYDVNGRLIRSKISKSDCTSINITDISKGIYIIRAGKTILKLNIK